MWCQSSGRQACAEAFCTANSYFCVMSVTRAYLRTGERLSVCGEVSASVCLCGRHARMFFFVL